MKFSRLILALALATCLYAGDAAPRPKYLEGVGIEQKLNAQVPLNAQFNDEFGRPVTLDTYMHRRPVVLALVYFTCPALCDQIMHGIVAAMRPLELRPGRDYDVMAISINPNEKPSQAAEKRLIMVNTYAPNASMNGWHFLTGNEQNIRAVADAVGFHYRYDPASKMFFHGAGFMVLTPEGKVARYLYGVYFEPKDLKLSLIEASHDKIGSPVDQILLFCCHYDAVTGKYSMTVLNLLHASAAVFLALLIAGMVILWRRNPSQRESHT